MTSRPPGSDLASGSAFSYLGGMRYSMIGLSMAAWIVGSAAATPAIGQVPSPDGPRVVQVSARATVQQAPDRAVVQLAVETIAETAVAATARNAATMQRVLGALRQLGVPEAQIRTTRIELHPRYDHRREAPEPVLVGYQAMNQVMVRLDDIAAVGPVVDAAVAAGANRVTGIRFELSDPDAAYHEALRIAVGRARAEAEVVARALGESLGPALQVSTGGLQLPPPEARMQAVRMEMDVAPLTPVQPGELDVHATVSITYRLES
jgi:uncharacterized protein